MLTYLIDDDIVSLFLTEQVLRLEGPMCPILSFSGAEKALDFLLLQLPSAPPELIFLDLNMPMMNGWQFLEALTPYAHLLQGQCRIYLLTSSLALADTAKTQDYPLITGIIHKPLGQEEIKAILAESATKAVIMKSTTANETNISLQTLQVSRAQLPHFR